MPKLYTKRVAYGLTPPNINIVESPKQAFSDPTVNDRYDAGQLWLNQTDNTAWLLVSYTGGIPIWIQIDNSNITGVAWVISANNAIAAANNTGYIVTGNPPAITLPANSPVGTIIQVVGRGANNWQILTNAGQRIVFNGVTSLAGAGVRLVATHAGDTLTLTTTVADVEFTVIQTNDNLNLITV